MRPLHGGKDIQGCGYFVYLRYLVFSQPKQSYCYAYQTNRIRSELPASLYAGASRPYEDMKHSFLRQISACVDWRGIRTLLNKKYTKIQNATGNPVYDALMMFKILLLQTWYSLSDYEVEEM